MTFEVYTKLVYTETTKTYHVDDTLTTRQLVDYIRENVYHDMNIENNRTIEIVETGQFNNINGRDPEVAAAFVPSDVTLTEQYGGNNSLISFYIRIVDHPTQ
jgi:hypothetical protein